MEQISPLSLHHPINKQWKSQNYDACLWQIFFLIHYVIKYDGRYFIADVPKKQKVCYEFPPKKEE